jgi:hypothetical protein
MWQATGPSAVCPRPRYFCRELLELAWQSLRASQAFRSYHPQEPTIQLTPFWLRCSYGDDAFLRRKRIRPLAPLGVWQREMVSGNVM